MVRLMTVAALIAISVWGCMSGSDHAGTPTLQSGAPVSTSLNVSNGTTLDVTIEVNGTEVAQFPAEGQGQITVDDSKLPPVPWNVAARSPSGRILATMTVTEQDVEQLGMGTFSIPMGRVDLSCGRLTMWAGDYPPSGPVPPSPAASPGSDCAP